MAGGEPKTKKVQEERTPPSGDTLRASNFPQPSRGSGEDELPLLSLGSVDLEKFCRGLLRIEYPKLTRTELKREKGEKQFGVDVEGFDPTHQPVVVVSCKCYREPEARDLLPWTKEFTRHLDGHWKDRGVGTFVLAVTCDGNCDDINAAARAVAEHLKAYGIAFDLWTNQKMSDLARKDPGLVRMYFSRYWQETFFPHSESADVIAEAGTVATAVATSPVIAALSKEIAALLSERDSAVAKRIDEAQVAFRAGQVSRLKACLDEIQGSSSWASMDGDVRAKTLRARALLALHEGDGESALRHIEEADGCAAPADRALRALALRLRDGAQAALSFLGEPASERETEAKASLLLELGEVDKALTEVERADRPEGQRLKSIALCLIGNRERAVAVAEAARDAEPNSVLAQQTLAILHVMAALSPRAEPQFGSMPNPIDPGLVRGTQDALDHLAKAEAVFSHLTATLEMPAKAEVEIWRLASLILHEDRRAEARKLGRELLGRAVIEPIAVAWCRLAGLPVRRGHVRKLLADALRQGHGSPSHVVVDALLAADKDGPSAAVTIIDRHAQQFPNAADFFKEWRARFTGEDEDDVAFAALPAPDKVERFAKLAEKIKTGAFGDDVVLARAEAMAVNGAWTQARAIQERLTEIGTPRAIAIAAHAAFNTGTPAQVLRLLDDFKACFRHGELPPSLLDLKARAHDALGDKSSAIAGYEQAVARTNDPRLRRRLMETYLRIGNLGSARHHAEQFVFGRLENPTDAVALADIWKGADPDFSRKLVVHATTDPRLPIQAAPHAFALAVELGLKEVEARLAPIVFDVKTHGPQTGVVAIDSVEALIAHMNARAEGIRQKLAAWLSGQQWSHSTWTSDVRTFALLYLAEPEDRYDAIGQEVPMLLSSAGVERHQPPTGNGKPVLVIDISALLIAARLQLVEALSTVFTIKIPEAVPAAILEMEKALPSASDAALSIARELLSNVDVGLRLVMEAPMDAPSFTDKDDPSRPDTTLLAKVLANAVVQGRLPQTSASTAAEKFGIPLAALKATELPTGLVVSRGLALQLAEIGVLNAICRTVPTYWTVGERTALTSDIAQGERMKRYRALLVGLRATISGKLQDNSWNTLPKRFDTKWDKRRQVLRPHVLSLAETAGALESGLEGLYWIEDRYVQRWPDARLVNIIQILQLLEDKSALTAVEHEVRRAELRRIGYGFQAPDIAAIVRDVLSAPVVDDQLTETPELCSWRSWLGREAAHLQHCNHTPAYDPTGRIIGEGRHTLDVMSGAREILWEIWCAADQTESEKVLRSSWVWSHLRIEQMPFFPVVAANAGGARSLVAVSIAHIADVPLLSLMVGEDFAKGPAKTFLLWLFSMIVEPRCQVDPEFETEFLAQLKSTVVATLDWTDDGAEDADRENVAAHIRKRANDYLDLLPPVWRDRLLADPELARRLRVATILTATLSKFEFDAVQLAEAIATLIASLPPHGELEQAVEDRRGQRLTLRVKDEGESGPAVSLKQEKTALVLDPVVVALHVSDPQKRNKALGVAASDLDGPPDKRAQRLRELAAHDTVADRIKELRTLHRNDFSIICRRVRDGIQNKQSVERSDLTLPEPSVLQAYLRMTESDGQEWVTLPDRLFARLAAELGVEEAIERLAGCPFRPGADIDARIGASIDAAFREDRLEDLPMETALQALMYVRGLKGEGPDRLRSREAVIARLLDLLVPQAPLFIALLSHAARKSQQEASWASLPREVASLLVWVWADRLSAALMSGGADPEAAAKIIRDAEPSLLTEMIDHGAQVGWLRETVRALDDGRLLSGVVAEVVTAAGEETGLEMQRRLLNTAGHFQGGAWMPRLDSSFPPALGPAGYWPSEDPVAKVAASELTPMLHPFDIRSPTAYVHAVLTKAENEVQPEGVLAVLSFVDVTRLEVECVRLLRERLPALLAKSEALVTSPGYRRGLALLASTIAMTGAAKECEALIAEHAQRMAAQWPDVDIGSSLFEDPTEPHQGLSMLIEMGLGIARHRSTPLVEKVQWIGSATELIVGAWPKSVRGALCFLDRSIERLSVKDAAPLWPAFNRLRTRC